MMDLLDNFDDIDGPGNNSYLWYDAASGQFTVVPWDMNLAFGGRGGIGGRGNARGRSRPTAWSSRCRGFELLQGASTCCRASSVPPRWRWTGWSGEPAPSWERFMANETFAVYEHAPLTCGPSCTTVVPRPRSFSVDLAVGPIRPTIWSMPRPSNKKLSSIEQVFILS